MHGGRRGPPNSDAVCLNSLCGAGVWKGELGYLWNSSMAQRKREWCIRSYLSEDPEEGAPDDVDVPTRGQAAARWAGTRAWGNSREAGGWRQHQAHVGGRRCRSVGLQTELRQEQDVHKWGGELFLVSVAPWGCFGWDGRGEGEVGGLGKWGDRWPHRGCVSAVRLPLGYSWDLPLGVLFSYVVCLEL